MKVEILLALNPPFPTQSHTWNQVADGGVSSEVEIFPDVSFQKHVCQDALCFVTRNPWDLDLLDSQGGRALAIPGIQNFGGSHTLVGGRSVG